MGDHDEAHFGESLLPLRRCRSSGLMCMVRVGGAPVFGAFAPSPEGVSPYLSVPEAKVLRIGRYRTGYIRKGDALNVHRLFLCPYCRVESQSRQEKFLGQGTYRRAARSGLATGGRGATSVHDAFIIGSSLATAKASQAMCNHSRASSSFSKCDTTERRSFSESVPAIKAAIVYSSSAFEEACIIVCLFLKKGAAIGPRNQCTNPVSARRAFFLSDVDEDDAVFFFVGHSPFE